MEVGAGACFLQQFWHESEQNKQSRIGRERATVSSAAVTAKSSGPVAERDAGRWPQRQAPAAESPTSLYEPLPPSRASDSVLSVGLILRPREGAMECSRACAECFSSKPRGFVC